MSCCNTRQLPLFTAATLSGNCTLQGAHYGMPNNQLETLQYDGARSFPLERQTRKTHRRGWSSRHRRNVRSILRLTFLWDEGHTGGVPSSWGGGGSPQKERHWTQRWACSVNSVLSESQPDWARQTVPGNFSDADRRVSALSTRTQMHVE